MLSIWVKLMSWINIIQPGEAIMVTSERGREDVHEFREITTSRARSIFFSLSWHAHTFFSMKIDPGFPPDRRSQWSPLIARFACDYVVFSHIMSSEAETPFAWGIKIPEGRMASREFDMVPNHLPQSCGFACTFRIGFLKIIKQYWVLLGTCSIHLTLQMYVNIVYIQWHSRKIYN